MALSCGNVLQNKMLVGSLVRSVLTIYLRGFWLDSG